MNSNKAINDKTDSLPVDYYTLTPAQALETQGVAIAAGLTESVVLERQTLYGLNEVSAGKKATLLELLWEQINSVLIYVLLVGAALSFGFDHAVDGIVILGVIVINISVSLYMERKANETSDALKNMMSPTALVLRDGERQDIPSKNLVPGDIVFLQAGDVVPADGRLLACHDLFISEAALTGESHAINKSLEPNPRHGEAVVPIGDRTCMAFAGTQVQKGSGTMIVTAIGSSSEVGKIGDMLSNVKAQKTPLVLQLEVFGLYLSIGIISLALVALGVALGRGYSVDDAFAFGIGIAVAAIPEGLPSVVTITFAVGVNFMAKQGAVMKSLPAVETLGSVSVICSDKTGTLTMNQMTVKRIGIANRVIILDDNNRPMMSHESKEKDEDAPFMQYLLPGILCNDAEIKVRSANSPTSKDSLNKLDLEASSHSTSAAVDTATSFTVQGDPTESCILAAAGHLLSSIGSTSGGRAVQLARKTCPRVSEIPFDSATKYMATMHMLTADQVQLWLPPSATPAVEQQVILVKGAPERVISLTTPTGAVGDTHDEWKQKAEDFAKLGMRVLGLAYRGNHAGPLTEDTVLAGEFTMVGLLGIIDPPRPDAIVAVKEAQSAGITVKMITGDHPATAAAIGKQLGLQRNPGRNFAEDSPIAPAITGTRLDEALAKPTMEDFDRLVRSNDIFARTTPEHKLQIVQSLQRQSFICSMTGDGVNDAPALKAANIGVAMGITGTGVAKDAAQMILTDDNFATIVQAVKIGRTTYHNLVKVLAFVLPTNGGQAFSIVMALIIGLEVPITALQILWVNMVTSITLGMVLAFEKPHPEIMDLAPRRSNKPVFGRFLGWRLAFVTMIIVFAVLGNFQWEKSDYPDYSVDKLRTISVNTLSVCQVTYLFSCRYLRTTQDFHTIFLKNSKFVWMGVLAVAVLQALFTYAPPFQYIFKTEAMNGVSWGKCILFGVITFLVVEAEKIFARWTSEWRYACCEKMHWSKLPREENHDIETGFSEQVSSSVPNESATPKKGGEQRSLVTRDVNVRIDERQTGEKMRHPGEEPIPYEEL